MRVALSQTGYLSATLSHQASLWTFATRFMLPVLAVTPSHRHTFGTEGHHVLLTIRISLDTIIVVPNLLNANASVFRVIES